MGIREKLAQSAARRFACVTVPIVGEVRLQSLTAREMQLIRQRFQAPDGTPVKSELDRIRQYLVAASVVDDSGATAYTLDDVSAGKLDDIDGGVLDALTDAIKHHTGWGADATWSAVGDAVKN